MLRPAPTAAAGLAFVPSPQLLLEANLMWTGWSSYDSLTVDYASLGGDDWADLYDSALFDLVII